ncbi:Radical SAM domain protein [Desulfitobacterium hafniense DCB-2]|uniref:Radical SAM domain protein n=1 Tax=Desulfitobacterium hafniense (strain DSM 10664 / DCB-2) TaxID=272564 RepID=B8FTU8_DESHD|nr:radical SAM protein [Desulfitobacterium hafniense]ACL22190.1 Radical SAM domain protein [Desulfitobacterium hafniense DCB-2]
MAIRAKTNNLIQIRPLTGRRLANSEHNRQEMKNGATVLTSKPQRLVFELTNACNLNCLMCGRNSATFELTRFNSEWFKKFEPIMSDIEEVTLMGWGEPTIHPQFKEMLQYLHERGIRKYFCTNGMRLDVLKDAIFDYEVDVFAVSMDGADAKTNEFLRRGLNYQKVIEGLKAITNEKALRGLNFPHINFVMTMMKSNIRQLPDMVDLAAELGLNEVKGVFLTAFSENLLEETLFDDMDLVRYCFGQAEERAAKLGILLKLPHQRGEDPAGDAAHKPCFTAWRDFFLGSDGYVRACMSSPEKLFHIDQYPDFESMWNSREYQEWRAQVNVPGKMCPSCGRCYQSSFANWNKEHAFIQIDTEFSPKWEK